MMEKLTAISIPNGYARDEISEISDFALRPLGGPLSSPTGWVFAQRCGFGAFGFMARPLSEQLRDGDTPGGGVRRIGRGGSAGSGAAGDGRGTGFAKFGSGTRLFRRAGLTARS
jgi:hypothetical protein